MLFKFYCFINSDLCSLNSFFFLSFPFPYLSSLFSSFLFLCPLVSPHPPSPPPSSQCCACIAIIPFFMMLMLTITIPSRAFTHYHRMRKRILNQLPLISSYFQVLFASRLLVENWLFCSI